MLGRRAVYDIKQTAEGLGISESILMQEVSRGLLKGKGEGRHMKFSRQNIEEYEERQIIDNSK